MLFLFCLGKKWIDLPETARAPKRSEIPILPPSFSILDPRSSILAAAPPAIRHPQSSLILSLCGPVDVWQVLRDNGRMALQPHPYFVPDWRTRSFQSVSSGSNGPARRSTRTPSNCTSAGSNQSANVSFAFATASSSVSPALAHSGSSGKTADQRCTSGSNSMTRRSFKAGGYRIQPNSHALKSVKIARSPGR